jgi:hypothetical protein
MTYGPTPRSTGSATRSPPTSRGRLPALPASGCPHYFLDESGSSAPSSTAGDARSAASNLATGFTTRRPHRPCPDLAP